MLAVYILIGYLVWIGSTYFLGNWIDDTMYDNELKDTILGGIVATWLPAVILYVCGIRIVLMERWLILGCKESQAEITSDFFD